jgi:TnpA family transposase
MPGQFLTDAERERLRQFPAEIPPSDVIAYFTLSPADLAQVRHQRGDHNRLGFALQLGALRYLGFSPDDLTTAPASVVASLSQQLDVRPDVLPAYGQRAHTRRDHLQAIQAYLGFREAGPVELRALAEWLLERALEHDRPSLLFRVACEHLHAVKIVRPGVTRLERMVATARQRAQRETLQRLAPLVTEASRTRLDCLLVPEETTGRTPLTWLRQEATANSPTAIVATLEKLAWLRGWGVDRWDLSALTPNRVKFLAQLGRKTTNQALQRAPEGRRYPILLAFLHQSLIDLTDEVLDVFDGCLAETAARAGRELDEFRKAAARTTHNKLRLFRDLGRLVLDATVSDTELRTTIYRRIPPERLYTAVKECEELIRPLDESAFEFLERRYSYLRQFAPAFLEAFAFRSPLAYDPLLEAIELLRHLNADHRRTVPGEAPLGFIPLKWRSHVLDPEGRIDRHAYEWCVLWELRGALRAGNLWVDHSRRYANPETYLIPRERWPSLRLEVYQQLHLPVEGATQLDARAAELEALLGRVDQLLARNGRVRIEQGELIVSPLEAEERPASAVALEQHLDQRLPHVDLSELLIEVDRWTRFSQHFTHAGGSAPRSPDFLRHLYAAILAQGCNIGLTKMAQIADLSYDRLAWCTTWYLREDTLKAAMAAIVNFQYHQPLSHRWGGGTLSSSDGQRFPVAGKVRNAVALPRYFGYGRGVTFYTWTSDQFSQYGTKVIPATVRDATYVLDEILDNETELPIVEHTTDTAGYTELVFALFDLLGLQFAPRIRDLGDQHLYRVDRTHIYRHLGPRLKGTIKRDRILRRWDDLLRVVGSLKLGWVTASLFISKLQAYPRQNSLTRALQEYGRLIKTLFILRYLESEEYRRRINAQLNKGEALHALRRFLFFANEGKIRRKDEEDQLNQASCLNLVTNAVVAWNTVYLAAALDALTVAGYPVQEDDLVHLSPARYEHINPYGKYQFEVEAEWSRKTLRPLRHP